MSLSLLAWMNQEVPSALLNLWVRHCGLCLLSFDFQQSPSSAPWICLVLPSTQYVLVHILLRSLSASPCVRQSHRFSSNVRIVLRAQKDFVVVGTSSEELYGVCEAFYRKDMEPEDLFETISQCLLAAVDRDCLAGWGADVHVITKDGVTSRKLKARQD